jgi:hypothetical protein
MRFQGTLADIAKDPESAKQLLLEYLNEGEYYYFSKMNLISLERCRELLIAAGYTNAGLGLGTFETHSRMMEHEKNFSVHTVENGKLCWYDGVEYIRWLITETEPDKEFLEGEDPLRNQVIEGIDYVRMLKERTDNPMLTMGMGKWMFSCNERCLYFWVNPQDHDAKFGWYTSEQLTGWLVDKDPQSIVLKKNQPERYKDYIRESPIDTFARGLKTLSEEIMNGDEDGKRILQIALLECPFPHLYTEYLPLIQESDDMGQEFRS